MFINHLLPASSGQEFTDQLLTTRAYQPEESLFLCDDKHLFFGFICAPLNGLDSGLDQRLNGLLNQNWPPDTLVQCGLILSPDLNQILRQLRKIQNSTSPEFKSMLEQNIHQLEGGVKHPVTNGQKLRRGCLWIVTILQTTKKNNPKSSTFRVCKMLRLQYQAQLLH